MAPAEMAEPDPPDDDDDASRYDLMLKLQSIQFWLAGIFIVLLLILWRVW